MLAIGFALSADGRIAFGDPAAQEKPQPSLPKAAFRYVIVRNQITEGTRYPEGGSLRYRGVDVLLDAKSFSESTLRQLVELLAKRFPDSEDLFVNIYTNLDDVSTPEEADYIGPPNSPIEFPNPKYAWAFYVRNSENERLDYHTKEPGDVFKTIKLRGKK